MTTGRGFETATLLPDGNVLIAGRDEFDPDGSAEIYQSAVGTFNSYGGMLTQSAEGHAATLLTDGTVLLSGGWICCGSTLGTAQIYRPAVLTPAPVLFSVPAKGQGAIWNSLTGQVVSSNNPSSEGQILSMYTTSLIEGGVIPPEVTIGG